MNNMGQMMKKMQKMKEDMENAQNKLAEKSITSSAGGGMVEVTMNGHKELLALKIKPEVVNPDDIEMLQDLIISAYKDALAKVTTMISEDMGQLTSGINLPPGLF
ncbi:MAG: hypothetical protein RLZ12_753 [Bacillota bacterium]|jgi:DNA-binding YbaB/EbfC family protein